MAARAGQGTAARGAGERDAGWTIAYLVNRYPTVSHTFVRREIEALERLSQRVLRFSIRSVPGSLPDAADRAERERTIVVLGQSKLALLARAAASLTSPGRVWRAWRLAGRMAPRSPRGLVVRAAYLVEACWLAAALRRAGVDHLHAHFGTNPAAIARLVHALSGLPYSFTVHGPDEFDQPVAIDLAGKVADARFAVAISDYGRSQLCRWADPADWSRITVVRCGVDSRAIVAAPPAEAEGWDFCCVARLAPQKGLPILVDAAALLRGRGVPVRIVVIGDGDERPQLERQIAAAGLREHVVLLGSRSGGDVLAHLRAARAMVLPSFAEGLPVVIMEAFAAGTPVVTTGVAGIPELVDAACGWLVPPASAEKLADAMAAALSASADERRAMGEEGRRRVAEAHDIDRNAALLLARIVGEGMARPA